MTETTERQGKRKAERLSEQQIVDAALEIIRESGVDGLSMRLLSRKLNVTPMATYYYVADKQGLLDLVARWAVGTIEIPEKDSGEWYERLRLLIDRVETALRHNKGIAEVLLSRIMITQREVMNAVMEILVDAGFDSASVVKGYASIHTYLFGRYRVAIAQEETMRPTKAEADTPLEVDDTIARLMPVTRTLTGRDYYTFGIETLIYGLRVQLRRQNTADGLEM
ncbi:MULTISPECIES: TetR/AcrR family transcriptional regulator C-terminal domain-containing protein [Rhodococcus]|uniref:TetR/AcrR family transcriptional regulator C-terminal domain-containing protein n=1 Tax=Rhodococcus oxybenzonivorans TaxID=1990687 RepID=A0AAE5A569_9NOCA|nr:MULTISPECIES: TetR/AcrR family transcriptional regulator C-terminal domain-containing protein [Rhodococcus]MDV7241631.1 TetR/AcrR family transcriptional regulator C-terminal domain-containing protein [Rhodococcus oxybenzonivorans]MDV7264216.1 TetR/AcrR family transcriptional regulator C-terminal domain-containing protein [Rhodococcus oxybenzonivorans]MDV7273836.1 TetR/AcrR family transcriptional regulator C-terminal domain-containing protein [Rhodococcus oxybenzonivorans]MDV7333912.1 TetR/Ac